MKLTASPGSTVYLELYVVGEKEAIPINYDIKKEYCNYFDYGKIPHYASSHASDGLTGFIPREFFGPYMEIAHSDVLNVMWDGCVVTKFADKITSNEMNEDMFFDFKEANPFRSELYSSVGKLNLAYNVVMVVLIIGSILLAIYYRIRKSQGIKVSTGKLFITLLIVGATGFSLSYALVGEKTDVYSVERYWPQNFQAHLSNLFADPDNDFSTGAELIELLRREGIDNPITKEPIIIENSPGNIVTEKTGNVTQASICLENGALFSLFSFDQKGFP
jgi:hypothetical protein